MKNFLKNVNAKTNRALMKVSSFLSIYIYIFIYLYVCEHARTKLAMPLDIM